MPQVDHQVTEAGSLPSVLPLQGSCRRLCPCGRRQCGVHIPVGAGPPASAERQKQHRSDGLERSLLSRGRHTTSLWRAAPFRVKRSWLTGRFRLWIRALRRRKKSLSPSAGLRWEIFRWTWRSSQGTYYSSHTLGFALCDPAH